MEKYQEIRDSTKDPVYWDGGSLIDDTAVIFGVHDEDKAVDYTAEILRHISLK